MSDPYGQPSGQPDPYGQPPYGQSYGQYGAKPAERRPGTVTAAAWITMVFSAIAALIFGLTTLAMLVARDQVITEMERVPEFQDANIDADAAVGVLVAVLLGIVVWSVIAIVLAVFVLRRSNVARILLVISATVTALLSLLTITSGITIVTLLAAAATIVLLFVGGAGAWFKGLPAGGGDHGGYPQAYPGPGQQGGPDPYGSSYGQSPSGSQYPTSSDQPSGQNPYGQSDGYGQQPPPSQNPYGQPDGYGQQPPPSQNPYGQPPADGRGSSEHPPKDYPGRE